MSIRFANRNRSYMLHVPSSFNGTKPVPLVIDMHGFTSTANAQSGVSGFLQESDAKGFIVAWPSGLNNSWNAFGCCGNSLNRNVDDVGFIRAVVADIIAKGVIDESRVFATGLSNGGSMSHRLACQAADLFASTSPVSFTLNHAVNQCTPARPITVGHFHGINDTTVNFNGGQFESAPNSFADVADDRQVRHRADHDDLHLDRPLRRCHRMLRRRHAGAVPAVGHPRALQHPDHDQHRRLRVEQLHGPVHGRGQEEHLSVSSLGG